jgi:hypothetical protein
MVLRSPRRIRSSEVGPVVTFHSSRGMPIHTLYNLFHILTIGLVVVIFLSLNSYVHFMMQFARWANIFFL